MSTSARKAADVLLGKGVGSVLITLGWQWFAVAYARKVIAYSGVQRRQGGGYHRCR